MKKPLKQIHRQLFCRVLYKIIFPISMLMEAMPVCSTCRVLILEGEPNCSPCNDKEEQLAKQLNFDSTIRLACQTTINNKVTLPSKPMKKVLIILLVSLIFFSHTSLNNAQSQNSGFDLQAAIDTAKTGDIIEIPPGLYNGNFVIDKPITLIGIGWPVIDGDNQGTVIEINKSPDVTIRGLMIRNSGTRLDKENAGISVNKSPRFTVENNRLENTLFGIYIKDSKDSLIAHNIIGAKKLDVPARGDGIRVWYSKNTKVIGNRVNKGRDVVLWYNNGAIIRDNIITNGRYGLHFMYCDDNIIENNYIYGNSVGAFLMYSRRLTLRRNIFTNNRGPSGYGIGLKDLDGVEATDNLFAANRIGIYLDNSPWSVDVSQHFTNNTFSYNDIGLLFTPSVKRNYFSDNNFINNLEQVGLTGNGDFKDNKFTVEGRGNFWSDYTGYDTIGDGIGDLPYISKSLFENMMDRNPQLRLFQLSPTQQAIDLAAKAFPIFQPKPKFTDNAPLMSPVLSDITPPPPASVWPMWVLGLSLLAIATTVIITGRQPVRVKLKVSQ